MDASYNRQDPDDKEKMKYPWQKSHLENQTGTKNSHKPVKIEKFDKKNMKLGSKILLILIFIFLPK